MHTVLVVPGQLKPPSSSKRRSESSSSSSAINEGVNTSRRRSVHIQHGESLARGDGQLERLYIEGRRSGGNTE